LGQDHITQDDLHLAIKVALTTGSQERVAVLDVLVAKKGAVSIGVIANSLKMSRSKALQTMTELSAVGIARLEDIQVAGNPTQQIRPEEEFAWLYDEDFLKLRLT
jgi:predicted ArsR family transcriptional regulator